MEFIPANPKTLIADLVGLHAADYDILTNTSTDDAEGMEQVLNKFIDALWDDRPEILALDREIDADFIALKEVL